MKTNNYKQLAEEMKMTKDDLAKMSMYKTATVKDIQSRYANKVIGLKEFFNGCMFLAECDGKRFSIHMCNLHRFVL